jgi:hypothetical protein
MGTKHISILLI